jgi:hypothetical protein
MRCTRSAGPRRSRCWPTGAPPTTASGSSPRSARHGSWYFSADLPSATGNGGGRGARDNHRGVAGAVAGVAGVAACLDRSRLRRPCARLPGPYLGTVPLAGLSPADVQAMFTAIIRGEAALGRPVTAATLRRIHATLRAALNAAVPGGLIATNPGRYPNCRMWSGPDRRCGPRHGPSDGSGRGGGRWSRCGLRSRPPRSCARWGITGCTVSPGCVARAAPRCRHPRPRRGHRPEDRPGPARPLHDHLTADTYTSVLPETARRKHRGSAVPGPRGAYPRTQAEVPEGGPTPGSGLGTTTPPAA